jgi:rubrerythrin
LFDRYNIIPPANEWFGKAPRFANVHEACVAAVAGEIENVGLYDQALKSTQRPDIISVYHALRSASQDRHLPAFQRCVQRERPKGDDRQRGPRA